MADTAASTAMLRVKCFRSFGESSVPYRIPQRTNVPKARAAELTRYCAGSW